MDRCRSGLPVISVGLSVAAMLWRPKLQNPRPMEETTPNTKNVAFLGDYVPRRCGIATFTADICEAVAAEYPETQCTVGSVNDRPEGYEYPARVRFEIDEQELDSYRRAAEFLNINNVELISVQHE